MNVEIDIDGNQLYQYIYTVLDYKNEFDEDCKLIKWIELFASRYRDINDLKTVFDNIIKQKQNFDEELTTNWNNYLALANIIDGIISEEGELSLRYWENGVDEELNYIINNTKSTYDIINNKQRIIANFNMLMDGIDGWISEGKSISRYGELSKINRSLFNVE